MFAQSVFRWVPEDPLGVALTWTRGRLVYETPAHLRLLNEQILGLRAHAARIDDAMAEPLTLAQTLCTPQDWHHGLSTIGITPTQASIIRRGAPREQLTPHPDVPRLLRKIPVPNPFSQVWELRQLRSLYAAAEDILEDTFCDLALDLEPQQGWQTLAALTNHYSAGALQLRVTEQRSLRGEPGDPRRSPEHHY